MNGSAKCSIHVVKHGVKRRLKTTLTDFPGSERLKRSMASVDKGSALRGRSPNGQRSSQELQKEACEINKSLSQLALVIQRLTAGTASYVPYRDSVLTRLLAESFGGSSKTCLIITCSSAAENREETRCSLEFGKRAKLVRNRAEINLEVSDEISPFVRAFIAKEVKQLRQDRDTLETERDALLAEKASRQPSESGSSAAQLKQLEDDLEEMKKSLADASGVQRLVRESLQADIATMEADNDGLRRLLSKITKEKESLAGKAKKLEVEVASLTQRVDTSSDMQNSALEHSSDWTYGDTGDSKRSSGRGAVATGPSHKFIGDAPRMPMARFQLFHNDCPVNVSSTCASFFFCSHITGKRKLQIWALQVAQSETHRERKSWIETDSQTGLEGPAPQCPCPKGLHATADCMRIQEHRTQQDRAQKDTRAIGTEQEEHGAKKKIARRRV